MRPIKCERCGRTLGKLDDDGTFHIRLGKDGPQILARLSEFKQENFMMICPSQVYTPAGRIACGRRHLVGMSETSTN